MKGTRHSGFFIKGISDNEYEEMVEQTGTPFVSWSFYGSMAESPGWNADL